MKALFASLLMSAVLAPGTLAQGAARTGSVTVTTSSENGQHARGGGTTLRLHGTIVRYDVSSRHLSVATSTGSVDLSIGPAVRIRRGGKTLDAQDLEGLSGYRVAVRYSTAEGTTIVESVHVFDKTEREQR